MHEIELKFGVPPERAAEVLKAVQGRTPTPRTHLQASYYDTASYELAAAGMGWRVRREGRRWVQTLKAQVADGGDGLRREEHNVVVHTRSRPDADAALHAGTPAGDHLAAMLSTLDEPPGERFHTDVWRHAREVRVSGGRIELAYDTGTIGSGDQSLPVCELELELRSGGPTAVIDAARTWVTRHGVWLDAGTKAQRGVMLSRGLSELPLVKAPMPSLAKDMSVDAAVREMTRACLVQIIGNASAVAGGLGGHEHVHQTRIGIRKLRTVLTVFGDLSPAVDPSWPDQLAAAFERLGATRDREVVLATWIGALAEAGAPDVDLPAVADDDAGAHLREPALSVLWLDLLGFVHGVPVESDADLETIISKRLRRLRRKALRSADGFRGLDAEAQHQIRKRVKRLRYVSELTAGLFPAKKVQKYVKKLAPAQEALGQLNDIGVAAEMFRTIAPEKAEAWFAVGWLSSRRAEAVEECLAPMHKAANAKPHWGKK